MKISNIETYPVWGGHRNFLFVVVETDEGIYGVGEAGIVNPAVSAAVEHFKPLIVGQDPMRMEHFWQVLYRGGGSRRSASLARRLPPSTLRCGTFWARRSTCRSSSCWAARCAIRWSATHTTRQGAALPHSASMWVRPWRSHRWSNPASRPKKRAGSLCAGGCPTTARSWSRASRCSRRSNSSKPCARP